MKKQAILAFAKENGYDAIAPLGKWNGYDAYESIAGEGNGVVALDDLGQKR